MKTLLSLALAGLCSLSLAAQDAESYYQEGNFYFDAHDFPRAIDMWRAGTRVDPRSERLWFNLALAQLALDRYADAATSLRTLVALAPDDVQAYQLLGNAYDGMEQYLYAADAYTESYQRYPDPGTLLLRAAVYLKQNELALAQLDYQTVADLQADNAIARAGLGDVQAARQDWHGAIAHYDAALRLAPDDALTLYRRGRAKMEVDYYDTAIFDLSNAIALHPYLDEFYAGRALCRLEIADPYGAQIDARRARRYNPENADAWFALGRLAAEEDDYYTAANDFNMALLLREDHAQYRYARGKIYHAVEAYLPAAEDFRVAASLDPELEEIDKWLARAEAAHAGTSAPVLATASPVPAEAPTPAVRYEPMIIDTERRARPAANDSSAVDAWMLQPEE